MIDGADAHLCSKRKLWLFTTCIVKGEALISLERLVQSVDIAEVNIDKRHVILLQGNVDEQESRLKFLEAAIVMRINDHVSLSKARNIMLGCWAEKIADNDIVGFPDDDACYPQGYLSCVKEALETYDVVVTARAKQSDGVVAHLGYAREISSLGAIAYASSNSIFGRGKVVKAIGFFDEALGVGAKYNGAEDSDYTIRMIMGAGGKAVYLPKANVIHDDFKGLERASWERRRRYWPGEWVVLCRYVMRDIRLFPLMLRKLSVGLSLMVSGRMPLSTALEATLYAVGRK